VGLRLPKRLRQVGLAAAVAGTLLVVGGCSDQDAAVWQRGAMPVGASDRSDSIITFWQWSWVAALATGVLVWGLILFAVVKYRRRSDDEIPVQTRYNLPMEIMYTVAPVIMVLVFFKFVIDTAHEVKYDGKNQAGDHNITVVGQQWSWTFNYNYDSGYNDFEGRHVGSGPLVYDAGTTAHPPTLWLVKDKTVEVHL